MTQIKNEAKVKNWHLHPIKHISTEQYLYKA